MAIALRVRFSALLSATVTDNDRSGLIRVFSRGPFNERPTCIFLFCFLFRDNKRDNIRRIDERSVSSQILFVDRVNLFPERVRCRRAAMPPLSQPGHKIWRKSLLKFV